MKKYIIGLLAIAAIVNIKPAFAQQKPYETTVDGVKVIVQPSGNEIVEIQTIIRGGVQNYGPDKQGIEALAMRGLTECGTLKHDKNSFKDALDKVDAAVYGSAGKDYSVIRMNCIKNDFDTVWPLYVEAITQPKFDTTEFHRIKRDALTNLKAMDSQPDFAIDKMANDIAFKGRSYSELPQGTADVISKLTAQQVKDYYNSILTRSRMFVVVVADLPQDEIEAKVKDMLTNIRKGAPFQFKTDFFRVYQNSFNAEPRQLATNYIEGVTSGPELNAPDFYAFQIAFSIFYNRHFLDVRTKNGLSYAPQVFFNQGATTTVKFRVSTTKPNDYIAVFDKLVDSTKKHGFNEGELADMKQTFLTGFYYKNETNAAQASSIASNEVLHGDWKRSINLIDNVKKLTVQDINNAFTKYVGSIVWVYQGDPKQVNPVLYKNGTLRQADNPVTN
jgi:predicted Zn-dependent peptidase